MSDNEGRCVLDSEGNFIVIDPMDYKAELNVGVFDYRVYDGMLHADSGRFIPIEKNGPPIHSIASLYSIMRTSGKVILTGRFII